MASGPLRGALMGAAALEGLVDDLPLAESLASLAGRSSDDSDGSRSL